MVKIVKLVGTFEFFFIENSIYPKFLIIYAGMFDNKIRENGELLALVQGGKCVRKKK